MFVILVSWRKRREAKGARLRAAATLLRESQLNMAITRGPESKQSRFKPVLEIMWRDGDKHSYLFDPVEPIRIGRDYDINQICIRRDTVSNEHCILVMYNGALTVQDLNSSNGTYIKRGMRKYKVKGRVYVNNGDYLIIGGIKMKLHLFAFDATYI